MIKYIAYIRHILVGAYRGGVKDTRLDAKAKDTGASVLQKEEGSSKIFFRRSQR